MKGTRSGAESTLSLAATNPVSVGGSAVTLALAAAVQPGDTVTVAYAAPATGAKLQDSDNAKHPVPDFSAQTVTNATRADTNGPGARLGVGERRGADDFLRRGAGRECGGAGEGRLHGDGGRNRRRSWRRAAPSP